MHNFIFFLIVFLLLGCSSLHKIGDKYFSDENYKEAAEIYAKILSDNPNDHDAKYKLKLSRDKILDSSLIQVRKLRLSGNHIEAINRLNDILKMQTEWQTAPKEVAFFTQKEETELLFAWYKKQIQNDLDARMYLKAKVFTEAYGNIFIQGDTRTSHASVVETIQKGGSSHCDELLNGKFGSYAKDFINRYCIVWNSSYIDNRNPSSLHNSDIPLFSEVNLKGELLNVSNDIALQFRNQLQKTLESSPYFSASGKPLVVTIKGAYKQSYGETSIPQAHNYVISVPYTDVVQVPYSVSVPFTDYTTQVDYSTGYTSRVPFTNYRYETRYKNQTVTKYRDEGRVYNYNATLFKVLTEISGYMQLSIDKTNHNLSIASRKEFSGIFHDISKPSIGLNPIARVLPNTLEWLSSSLYGSATNLQSEISNAWQLKYCKTPTSVSESAQIEAVMKCIKGTNAKHDFVENWFLTKFGMPKDMVFTAISFANKPS